ncbi:DUF4352 domain-containing protein [Actinoplanes sp. KI2]|uniref:DUF4352 domain-containing protein n=1 Tax=Actinoplanes sp. KI2 TaxID=2983315 RepID=UPI0021D5C1D9|nr:DUF4352 domain-containing protein [Actinoplanes sp. KI2]MCU7726450.1 DUF4352 domain-containing protein [Actinoplanes sp. KI2]
MSYEPRPQRRPPLKPLYAGLLGLGAIVVLLVAGVAVERFTAKEPAAATTTPTKSAQTAQATPGVGAAVRDGKFEFVVSQVDCSHTTLGQEHLKRTAKGKFCIVSLSARNIADGAQFFLSYAQKGFDAAGTEYGVDEIADLYVNRDTRTFLDRVAPGERVAGKIVFDVPKTVTLTTLELHDSLLSGGVRVRTAR